MINRDENGVIVSADSIAEVTEQLAEIESLMKKTIKCGTDGLSQDEKSDLISKIDDMKALVSIITPEIQKCSKPLELVAFVKQIMKIKSTAENFKKVFGDITAE